MLKKLFPVFLLFVFCAQQIPPSGGPDDKVAPVVRYAKPVIGTVNYPVSGNVSFIFSEWIDKKAAEKCVSIFPPPSKGTKIKVSGKTLELRPVPAFAESTTYHIELNTSLNDLHGNSIGTPYHFFFSTGPTIDSGKVFGCIVTPEKQSPQPKAALFAGKPENFPDTGFFGLPSYVVQTDSSGNFAFEHIRRGTYHLIAFSDANNDNRLQPAAEKVFAPVEKTVSLDSAVGPIPLYPVTCDTQTNRILSLKPISSTILSGTWAKAGDSLATALVNQWRVERLDTASRAPAIKEYVPVRKSANFLLQLTDSTGVSSYRLIYKVKPSLKRTQSSPALDTIRFNGVRKADTIRPSALGFFPTGTADCKPRIKITWSKPVSASAASWTMADSLGDTVKLSIDKSFGDSTIFTATRSLKTDRRYRLRVPDTIFSDINGNHPRDSTFGKYAIQTISSENLCYSLSGGAACLSKNSLRKWLFLPLASTTQYSTRDSCGRFRFDSIPSGKGRIASFIDLNNDNIPTSGNLFPWLPPEPYQLYPDTVEARARWDIEGIEAPACALCVKKNPPSTSTIPSNNGNPENDTSFKKTR